MLTLIRVKGYKVHEAFSNACHFVYDNTANVYREIQGGYREIGVQGFHIYRDILGMRLAVTVTVKKLAISIGILFSL